MNKKVKEVQEYLEKKGFEVPETAIVDMAIDLTRVSARAIGPLHAKPKRERKKQRREDDTA